MPQTIEAEPVAITESLTVEQKISKYADQYGVSEEVMKGVIKCESGFNPNALGDSGRSRGLVQIHAPSHPTITDEQAYDEDFAIEFLAKNLKEGKGSMWTCYRKLYS